MLHFWVIRLDYIQCVLEGGRIYRQGCSVRRLLQWFESENISCEPEQKQEKCGGKRDLRGKWLHNYRLLEREVKKKELKPY